MSLENAKPLLEEYGALKEQAKEIAERLKELDREVRPLLVDAGDVLVGNHLFTCKMMPGRKTLDKKAMIADGINVGAYEKVGAPYTQLTMKKVETV